MAEDIIDSLLWGAMQILRPVVSRLLALGVPFGRFEARSRDLFVEVAERDFALPGRRQTDSRVSLLSGINRKEVRRIRSAEKPIGPSSFSMNYTTSLISRWLTDSQTTDRAGQPRQLPYQAQRGPSFVKLARKVTADLAPRVLLDELVRSGAAELREDNIVVLTRDAYVPRVAASEKLQILGEDPPELIETILRNIFAESTDLLLQRKVYYDNFGRDAAKQIRAAMRREGERFVRRVNRLLAKYDRDRNPDAPGGERHYAGLGVYFFESPEEREPQTSAPRKRRRSKE